MQLYDHGAATHRKGACCAGQDIHDARDVAERLGFPHYVLDYETRFRQKVIEPFARAYVSGETPVPCVACNQQMKFADLFEAAKDLGADVLATGHYVVSEEDGRGGRALYRAADPERDQSYFLFATTREQLTLLRFPLGAMPKPEVRALAREFGLAVADKADSQDICFVPAGHYSEMIERLLPGAAEAGDIVHIDGRVLGRHAGILHYTIGQRRGLGIAAAEPLYVVALDARAARVVVGPRQALETRRIRLRDVNWIGEGAFADIPERGLPSPRGCAPPARPPPRRCCPAAKSSSTSPRAAFRRAKPASSTPLRRARECSAEGSSWGGGSGLRGRSPDRPDRSAASWRGAKRRSHPCGGCARMASLTLAMTIGIPTAPYSSPQSPGVRWRARARAAGSPPASSAGTGFR